MISTKRILALSALAALAAFPSCNSNIDDADGPHVILEAENLTIPPVNGQVDTVTQICTFSVQNANVTFKNKPKNEQGASSPFNDIVLENVHVTYDWGPGGQAMGPADFGLGGTVPANGSAPAQFAVVSGLDLSTHEGQIGSLTLTFSGHTVSGEAVSTTTGGTIAVGTCQ
ncbi:MAG TPA: hypothetical protein VJ826_02830 [Candidatus Polarisedimenticolaceae bacterium]|nr:hypothetical protein [Candidatus Polarisedimenticolaceae bacterium]